MRRAGRAAGRAARAAALPLLLTLAGLLAPAARVAGALLVPPAGPGAQPAAPWQVLGLPQQAIPPTRFSVVALDGQRVLRVETQAGYGNLVHPVADPPGGQLLRWRWRLDQPVAGSDLHRRDGDDSPLKVCALFDLPLSAVPFVERQLLRLARLRSGQALPAASVCYVWDARLAPGTVLDNAYTRRVRIIVLRGPEAPLRSWHDEQRDLAADFQRLFGDESAALPPLRAIAISGDADNTRSHGLGYIGAIALE